MATARSAAPDAETRARLASLGYVAGPAASIRSRRGPASASTDPKTMVDLFQRFEQANAGHQDGELDGRR